MTCLLYTSDAADERSSVDLGGRRILKKKKREKTRRRRHNIDRKQKARSDAHREKERTGQEERRVTNTSEE